MGLGRGVWSLVFGLGGFANLVELGQMVFAQVRLCPGPRVDAKSHGGRLPDVPPGVNGLGALKPSPSP